MIFSRKFKTMTTNDEPKKNLEKKLSKFSKLLDRLKKEKPKDCKVVEHKSLGGGHFDKLVERI
tara:strand:- start:655 stop:843 length:189 start_codon:yes stop_codon:yes gene_type:complete